MTAPSSPRPAAQRRRIPRQERAQATVQIILVAAARVFRAEGFAATTNRIAEVAGVGIGSLYEYFPNKQALLLALACAHIETAEAELSTALAQPHAPKLRDFLRGVQRAILLCHQYPSQAIDLVENAATSADLRQRAFELRQQVIAALRDRVATEPDAELRARAAFCALAELAARALYELPDSAAQTRMAELGLTMALAALGGDAGAHTGLGGSAERSTAG